MADIKIRAKASDDGVVLKALMKHPMETGQRKDKNGEKIPAHYIEQVTVASGEQTLVTANWGPAISKNPYFAVRLKSAKQGDKLTVSWTDNEGKSATADVEVA